MIIVSKIGHLSRRQPDGSLFLLLLDQTVREGTIPFSGLLHLPLIRTL